MTHTRKVIILGLDGATFDVLLPRVEAGQMPHLGQLLSSGASGTLQSTIPPFSAQAWVSMATGKNQARHGVVDFWQRQPDLSPGGRRDFVDARQVQGETLWQVAGRHGLHVGIVNVPVTYPPHPVHGYLVSGFLTPQGRTDYAYPADLRREIEALVPGYEPDPFDPVAATASQALALAGWMEKHERVARHLAETRPADLYFSVVQALDHLQHLFWNDVVGAVPGAGTTGDGGCGTLVNRCYTLADDIIGHRVGLIDERTTLFLVSDHGFGPANKSFHVNRFLEEEGLLAMGGGEAGDGIVARLGLTPERVRGVVRRLDVLGLRRHMGRLARVTLGRRLDAQLTPPVDWSRTQAVSGSPATEGIYLNVRGREPAGIVEPGQAYEALRERIITALGALHDPETGEPVVRAAYRREEIYAGPFLDQIPDVVFDLGDGPYLANDALGANHVIAPLPPDYLQGRHRPAGILVAAGPHVRRGMPIEGARIVDVMPTVLYSLGLPVPRDVDGRVLEEIFEDEYREAHPVAYAEPVDRATDSVAQVYDDQDLEEMERRLRGLGYTS
ncbi:MAG: alkaline phosphatase family protein [Anaerolineae bacterium]|nr:alkaline phosphatase family protein [Anaerolineae bacterium]